MRSVGERQEEPALARVVPDARDRSPAHAAPLEDSDALDAGVVHDDARAERRGELVRAAGEQPERDRGAEDEPGGSGAPLAPGARLERGEHERRQERADPEHDADAPLGPHHQRAARDGHVHLRGRRTPAQEPAPARHDQEQRDERDDRLGHGGECASPLTAREETAREGSARAPHRLPRRGVPVLVHADAGVIRPAPHAPGDHAPRDPRVARARLVRDEDDRGHGGRVRRRGGDAFLGEHDALVAAARPAHGALPAALAAAGAVAVLLMRSVQHGLLACCGPGDARCVCSAARRLGGGWRRRKSSGSKVPAALVIRMYPGR